MAQGSGATLNPKPRLYFCDGSTAGLQPHCWLCNGSEGSLSVTSLHQLCIRGDGSGLRASRLKDKVWQVKALFLLLFCCCCCWREGGWPGLNSKQERCVCVCVSVSVCIFAVGAEEMFLLVFLLAQGVFVCVCVSVCVSVCILPGMWWAGCLGPHWPFARLLVCRGFTCKAQQKNTNGN